MADNPSGTDYIEADLYEPDALLRHAVHARGMVEAAQLASRTRRLATAGPGGSHRRSPLPELREVLLILAGARVHRIKHVPADDAELCAKRRADR